MKGVKNYLKNVTKSIAYAASDVAKDDLMPNAGDFLSSNKDFIAATYSAIKNPKAAIKKQVDVFKESKYYEAIDYGARNVFDDLKSGKFYNKEREDKDGLKYAGGSFDMDNWNDLSEFGIDDDWEEKLNSDDSSAPITAGDVKIVQSIESSNKAVANVTANAIAAAADTSSKNSRVNTGIIYSQNERLFGGMHSDLSILNATMDSIHKVITQGLPNIDKNLATYFSEVSKSRAETNAMLKEMLEMQREMYKSAQDKENQDKKSSKVRWSDINNNGMPDLSAYANLIKKNIKDKASSATGGMMDMFGDDSNMLATFMTNPLKGSMQALVRNVIPASVKLAAKELDNMLSTVFSTAMAKLANAKESGDGILSVVAKFLGVNTSVDQNISSGKYNKGAIPFDGITRKAIIDVIPSYLRKIEAVLTRSEEKLYDYDKGAWVTAKRVEVDFQSIRKNAINSSTQGLIGDMRKGISIQRKALGANEAKEFDKAVWQFRELLYNNNGYINPKVGAEANGIYPYQYDMLYKYYHEIMTAYMNDDLDLKSQRHTRLSAKNVTGEVMYARDLEQRKYRDIERSGHSVFSQIKTGGYSANKHGSFNDKGKFTADNQLLNTKDDLGNTIFNYLQKMTVELKLQRMNGSNDGGRRSRNRGSNIADVSDAEMRRMLMDRSLYNDEERAFRDKYAADQKLNDAARASIKSGESIDPALKETDAQKYYLQLATMIGAEATKEYYEKLGQMKNQNFITRYLEKNFYGAKNIEELNDAIDEAAEKAPNNARELSETQQLLAKFKNSKAKFDSIIGAPAEIFTNLLYTADRSIYDMMFKAEVKSSSDDDATTYHGFMDMIAGKTNKLFDKVSNKFDKDILEPLKKRFGIDDDFKTRFEDTFKNIGGQLVKTFINANKEVYGPLYEKGTAAVGHETKAAKRARLQREAKSDLLVRKSEKDWLKDTANTTLRNQSMRAVATGDYNVSSDHPDMLQTVEERSEFLINNGFIDQTKVTAGYYDDNAINKAYFRVMHQTHAAGTSNKPFMGLSTLHSGEAVFNSKGVGVVNNTGLYKIDEPTHILNQYDTNSLLGKGNNKSKASQIASDLADEKKLKNDIFHNADGSISGTLDSAKTKFKNADIDFDAIKKNAKQYAPEALAGGVVGGIASTILGIIGGPVIGAILGSTAGVISSSDALKDSLFGAKGDNGKRNGGKLFNQKIMGILNKYAPDTLKYGMAGILPGLITPLGPIGGLLVGGVIGYLKNNDSFMDKYFGAKDDNGERKGGKLSLDSKTKSILSKLFPGALKGAGAGTVFSLLVGGPFGILGNAAIGSAIGMITTTNEFKDGILGQMVDGVREGGLVGELRRVTDPLKQAMVKVSKDMLEVFDEYVVDPLSRFITPFVNQIPIWLGNIGKKVNDLFKDKVLGPVGGFIGKLLRPITKPLSSLMKGASSALKGFAKSMLNPFNILGFAGDKMKESQIRNGNGVSNSMTAAERMSFMARNKKQQPGESDEDYQNRLANSSSSYKRDRTLASIGTDEGLSVDKAKEMRDKLRAVTDSEAHLTRARNKKSREILTNISSWVRRGSDAKIPRYAIKDIKSALETDNLDQVEKILEKCVLIDTVKGESRRLTDDEINGIMSDKDLKDQLGAFKELTKRKKAVNQFSSEEARLGEEARLRDELNKIGLDGDLNTAAELINTEVVNREANSPHQNEGNNDSIISNDISKHTKDSANALNTILEILRGETPSILRSTKEADNIVRDNVNADDMDLGRSEDSSMNGGFNNAAHNVRHAARSARASMSYGANTAKDKAMSVIDDALKNLGAAIKNTWNNSEYYTNPINPTVGEDDVESHGIGTLLLGGLKAGAKAGAKLLGKGAGKLIKGIKSRKQNKAASDISTALGSANNAVEDTSVVPDTTINPQNGDAIKMKQGSDGSIEPDTTDAKTKSILNKLTMKEKFQEKLQKAQLKAAEIASKPFEDSKEGGKKLKWWQVLLAGLIAAPFLKKAFNLVIKPLWEKFKTKIWEKKLKPFLLDELIPKIASGIGTILSGIITALPKLISSALSGLLGHDKGEQSVLGKTAGIVMDAATSKSGNDTNAGGSTIINIGDHNAWEKSGLVDSETGAEVTYGDIANGNYKGDLINEQGAKAIIDQETGAITVNDESKRGSTYAKTIGNAMYHSAVYKTAGIGAKTLSKASGWLLKHKTGLIGKAAGLAGKAITMPLDAAAAVGTYGVKGTASKVAGRVVGAVDNVNSSIMGRVSNKALDAATVFKDGGKAQKTMMGIAEGAENLAEGSAGKTIAKAATKSKDKAAEGIKKLISIVDKAVTKLFGETAVYKKLKDLAEAIGDKVKTKGGSIIEKLQVFVTKIFKEALEKATTKCESSVVAKGLTKAGSLLGTAGKFLGKFAAPITFAADFLIGCDTAESILGVTDTSIVEEVAAGIINALCSFFVVPSVVPGTNWIAQKLFTFFGDDLKERQEKADAEVAAYNEEHGTTYSKDEYLENQYSATGKVKGAARKAVNAVKSFGSKVKDKASKAVGFVKDKIGGALGSIKDFVSNINTLWGYVKGGDIGKFATYNVESKDGDIGSQITHSIISTVKIPLLIPTLISKCLHIVGKALVPVVGEVKEFGSDLTGLFDDIKSGDLKSYMLRSSKEDSETLSGKIKNLTLSVLKPQLFPIMLLSSGLHVVADGVKAIVGFGGDIVDDAKTMWDYAKTGDIKGLHKFDNSDDDTISGKIKGFVDGALKVPLTVIAYPAKIINTCKDEILSVANEILAIKDSSDKVINNAKDGKISLFSKDYWTFNTRNEGLAGGLESVYNGITRLINAPSVLIANIFNNAKKYIDNIVNKVKSKLAAVKSFFDDPVNYIYNKVTGSSTTKTSTSTSGSGKYGKGYDKQIDPAIANIRYNAPGDTQYQTIGDSACGPAAAVTAVKSAFGRGQNDVLSASKYALSHGYKEKNGGTKPAFFNDYFSKNGLGSRTSSNKNLLASRLRSGYPTVLMGKGGLYGTGTHYLAATGTDGRGNVYIDDPQSPHSAQLYNMSSVLKNSSFGTSVYPKSYRRGTGRGKVINARGRFGKGKGTIIFIGDSRTVGMQQAVGDDGNIWSCLIGAGYSWFESTGVPAVDSQVGSDTAVVILMGVNDMLAPETYSSYASYINSKAEEWVGKGAEVYYVSVNPVIDSGYSNPWGTITNESIEQWNANMVSSLSSSVGYIDTYTQIRSSFTTIDGIHYEPSTYTAIYDIIKNAVSNGVTSTGSANNGSTSGGTTTTTTVTKPGLIDLLAQTKVGKALSAFTSSIGGSGKYGRGAGDVVSASQYALSNGYKEKDGGTKPEFFKDYFNKQGLDSSMSYNKSDILNNIKAGRPTVLMGTDPRGVSNRTPYGTNPHYVTVTGVDKNGNAIVQDPESKRDNQLYKMNNLLSKSSFGVSVNGRSKYGRGKRSRYGKGLRGSCNNEKAYNFFIDNGFTAAAAAGAVGNLVAETVHTGDISTSAIESNGEGVGIVQWSFTRKTDFLNYCQSQGDPFPNSNLELQLEYIMIELNSGQYWAPYDGYGHPEYCISYPEFVSSNDIELATGAWMSCYERPAPGSLDVRISNATEVYNSYSGNTAQAGNSSSGSTGAIAVEEETVNGLVNLLGQTKAGKALSSFTELITGSSSETTTTGSTGTTGSSGSTGTNSNTGTASGAAESATALMEAWAADESHGYSWTNDRYGNPDFDCSGSVCRAWEDSGVPVRTNGASYTGNMKSVFLGLGFEDVTSSVNLSNGDGLMRGDVLLNEACHTGMWTGSGIVQASISENDSTEGAPGDQTGKEMYVTDGYYNYPWDCVLRYPTESGSGKYGRGKNEASVDSAIGMLNNMSSYGMGRVMQRKPDPKIAKYKPLNAFKSYANSIKPAGTQHKVPKKAHYGTGTAMTDQLKSINQAIGGQLSTAGGVTDKLNSISNTVSSTIGGDTANTGNYSALLGVIIEALASIADNTDKLNVIVSLLNDRLGTNITSSDVSNEAINKESIKSKLKAALMAQQQNSDLGNYYENNNNQSMGVIISAMNAIASE